MNGFVLLFFYFYDLQIRLFQDKSSICTIHTFLAILFCQLFCFWKHCEEDNAELNYYMGGLGLICLHNKEKKNLINLKRIP